jgi:hypothetical protein
MPVPPSPHCPKPRQRGKPSVSKLQHWILGSTGQSQSCWEFPQAFAPERPQMPPATCRLWFWVQTPIVIPCGPVPGTQVTLPVSPPQHSWSVVQRLFRILQPRPGWQTLTPVSAHGPQLRLQQLPHPLQSTPSWVQLPAPVVWTSWQTPSVAPCALAHHPPQQSVSREQASPGWMQNDAPSTHLLFAHSPEQQRAPAPPSPGAPLAVHGLPAVRQAVLSGTHFWPVQFCPQHSADVVQAWLSAVQLAAVEQTPRTVSH